MKKRTSKILKIISATSFLIPIFSFSILSVASCSNLNTIQFANFESYMSSNLINRLHKKYDVQFTYFNTNEDIQKKFKKYYDIAIPSAYEMADLAQKNMLAKLDWKKFNIKNPEYDPNVIGSHYMIENATDALNLFGKSPVDGIEKENTLRYFLVNKHDLNNDGIPENILLYGIPYFAQDLLFAYKGNNISSINLNEKWNDLAYKISPSNSDVDQRFKKNGSISKIGLIDDSRTIYDIARIIQTQNSGETVSIYPQKDDVLSQMQTTYQSFSNLYKSVKDWFYLNTDSGWMSRTLADPNGLNGVIAYTGDIIYSAQGAGEFDSYNPGNFHVVHPSLTQENLDLIVINKNVIGSQKEQKIYDIIFDVALDGCNADSVLNSDNTDSWIGAKNSDGEYKYGTMLNYDSVGYTPTLLSVKNFVVENNGPEAIDYWQIDPNLSQQEKNKWLQFYHDIMIINYDLDFFDQPLTSLQKSDMSWAYRNERQYL